MNERVYNPCIGAAEFSHWALYTVHSTTKEKKLGRVPTNFQNLLDGTATKRSITQRLQHKT